MIAIIIIIIMAVLLLAAAIYSVLHRDLLFAVLGTGIVSVILSLFFYLLQAPDVALTEAAIGIALTTIIFVITIRNTSRDEDEIIDKENEKL
ncbi:MAG: hydrogenase subunit MbhD domain-containing protein [Bacteroidota bacterium]